MDGLGCKRYIGTGPVNDGIRHSHMSRQMLEHYSHVRMGAERQALEGLEGGLMKPLPDEEATRGGCGQLALRHNQRHNEPAVALS